MTQEKMMIVHFRRLMIDRQKRPYVKEKVMPNNTHGIINRPDRWPGSRDFGHEIKCENKNCTLNALGYCAYFSAIKIGPSGKCETGVEFEIKKEKDGD